MDSGASSAMGLPRPLPNPGRRKSAPPVFGRARRDVPLRRAGASSPGPALTFCLCTGATAPVQLPPFRRAVGRMTFTGVIDGRSPTVVDRRGECPSTSPRAGPLAGGHGHGPQGSRGRAARSGVPAPGDPDKVQRRCRREGTADIRGALDLPLPGCLLRQSDVAGGDHPAVPRPDADLEQLLTGIRR